MKLELHWKIIIGLILGLLFGVTAASQGWGGFTNDWIAPFGKIFINLLKLIAVPLVLSSLITGVASLSDLKKLSRIGGKTITIYITTTAIAVTIGLIAVNILEPGSTVPEDMKIKLQNTYQSAASGKLEAAQEVKERSVLQPVVDIVPSNFFSSASNNRNMLQVVFVAIIIGIALIQIPKEKSRPVLEFMEGINDLVIKLVDNIMLLAPIGVFALIADTITSVAGNNINNVIELLSALGFYMLAVIMGLVIHMLITYSVVLKLFSKMSLKKFYQGIAPAQLLGFSTSSSGATLPVTMERCEDELGVSEEVSSFVLPLGATINMDGTALYQAVAAVFIAQTLGMDLSIVAQLTIVLTAVLASIGTAAVPGAGIIMLVIILEAIGVPSAGIALILGVDRILDMMRTVTNVTGDASVAVAVASSENQLRI
ncbi:MAG: dicarboxylate/amino acid:cation symporter [Candidatus Marinimicrobia bacterium]|jgi:Na+/H+-dicarboxylate symporter|nr:dicarboxylate/amino acid:cation symporter [Candidatus Neomarinimicrobiota bacterium]MBT4150030.1 dicarboxylate/amino acid:cation symporter [Candidatus Neomarinimicrobiota bacterium]MBT4784358.1 dicarboxylate/amino acid:cation symporter [Candidatus Neomarinimicrobiota bacterium]MBT5440794.1 dicarboxylate/amino acid:cation symporter [Candidatus Neomarinimicrobiota bacterium]MBT7524455.1 dicarboxylate/amino acid:cation symporter [Candidatus Neomarinimicrobiota bacterium]|tara:strand:- start:9804 stop:11084 length:1281 start_codon:yes stop_codon:yes gene_type:complete